MRFPILTVLLFAFWWLFGLTACGDTPPTSSPAQNQQAFTQVLQDHLRAISNKNLPALKSTLSPEGNMQLLLPGTPVSHSVDSFVRYHEAWFQDSTWTFETKLRHLIVGPEVGLATVEALYREPERNGRPYFNKLSVTYGLQKIDGTWYVVHDHACSIEKSTDVDE